MNILHTVQFYEPSTGGMQTVVKQLSERLVRRGHTVTVATAYEKDRREEVINGVSIVSFDLSGNIVRGYRGELERYRDFVKHAGADIIVNFAAQQWATDALLPIIDTIPAKKVFVPTGFSALSDPGYRHYFEQMPQWMSTYDRIVFHSDTYQDAKFAKEHGIHHVSIIPNGAAADEFSGRQDINIREKLDIAPQTLLILLVGSHTGDKGHREAIQIFKKAAITNATLLIVGNSFGKGCSTQCAWTKTVFSLLPEYKKSGKKLRITELNRNETIAAYQTADLFLFPSRIECSPIVLFECLAAKVPFLTTDVGNAKEIAHVSGAGIVLPTRKQSNGYATVDVAGAIPLFEQLCRAPAKRRAMGAQGQAVWKKKFTWEHIAQQYERVYQQVLNH